MAQTYAQYVADVQSDMASEGYEKDFSTYYDIAECLLFDPDFKKLAMKKFGNIPNLREIVAHSLC
jgi:uncharacterized protein YutE (UPF0331/DUF86 family)